MSKESRVQQWHTATKEVLVYVCPNLFSGLQSDSRVAHHGLFVQTLLPYGKYVIEKVIDTGCNRQARAAAEGWYESFAAVVLAIIKGDTTGNCLDVYRAFVSVSKPPKFTLGGDLTISRTFRRI